MSYAPAVARELQEKEERLIAMCRSADFSLDKLRELFRVLEHEAEHEIPRHATK